jgi:hypothetical protein
VGVYETGTCTRTSNESDKKDVVKYLRKRWVSFSDEDRIGMCIKVAGMFSWPTGMQLRSFGVEGLESLIHFQVQLASSNTHFENVKSTVLNEWYEFEVLVKG